MSEQGKTVTYNPQLNLPPVLTGYKQSFDNPSFNPNFPPPPPYNAQDASSYTSNYINYIYNS